MRSFPRNVLFHALVLAGVLSTTCSPIFAANPVDSSARATRELKSHRTESLVVLDGTLDEPAWSNATNYDGFITSSPDVGLSPVQGTTVQLAHDAENLYFAIRAHDPQPTLVKSAIMGWDDLFAGDFVGVYVDALNDTHGAWAFYVNAHGSQGDRLVGPSGAEDAAPDNTWRAAASRDSLGYTVEMAIPLRSLRYRAEDEVRMGIGFVRHISRNTEYSHFPEYLPFEGALPTQLGQADYDDLNWQRTWELLPSTVYADRRALHEEGLVMRDEVSGTKLGATAKAGLTPTLTLDLAVNPDFSQVEADAEQADLNLRSLYFYPEKRPFFQEGSDYFAMAASGASAFATVLHTRRIIDPLVGFRVTGKAGSSNAVGVLYAEDEAPGVVDGSGERAAFATARYQRQMGEENFVGGIYASRRYRGRDNHVAGVDGVWRVSEATTLQGNGLVSHTREKEVTETHPTHHIAGEWLYRTRKNYARIRMHDVSKGFDLDSGFVPRDGVTYLQPSVRKLFYPGGVVQNVNTGYWGYVLGDKYDDTRENWHNFFVWVTMPRSSGFGLWRFWGNETYLGDSFEADGWYGTGWSQLTKTLRVSFEHRSDGKPRFTKDNPYQGDQRTSSAELTFEPGKHLRTELDLRRQTFTRRSDGGQVFDDTLVRLKTTVQLTRWFSMRAILGYRETDFTHEPLDRKLQGEFLASFNYLPGTVLYAGYGSLHRSGASLSPNLNPQRMDQMLEVGRNIFFKASYNWRI